MAKVLTKGAMPAANSQKSGFTHNMTNGAMRQASYSPAANNANTSRGAGICVGPGGMKQIGKGGGEKY
jgi:hypothetical protein